MRQHTLFLIFTLTFSFFLVTVSLAADPTPDPAVIKQAMDNVVASICSGHGGVNCSVINSDASIVCNDGTVDTSLLTIYAVPQCQATIEAIVTEQSDFMAESGCFPPSELRCVNEESYQNLFYKLSGGGLANAELSKGELALCRTQIQEYERDAKNYKQCLINNGRPNFELSGKTILPILKAVFCPLFYPGSSYDQSANLCLCSEGSFMYNNQCAQATQICQLKYGSSSYAKQGNCLMPTPTPPLQIKTPSPIFKNNLSPTPAPTLFNDSSYGEPAYTTPSLTTLQNSNGQAVNPVDEPKIGITEKIFRLLISGIKKIFRLP